MRFSTKQLCAAVAFAWAWPALIILLVTGDAKALLLLIAAPVVGWTTWRMSGTQMRKHGGRQLWPPVGVLAVLCLLLMTGCGEKSAGPAPNSIAAARATDQAESAPTPAATTPPDTMAVADRVPVDSAPLTPQVETSNQAEPGLDRLVVALAVAIGIPAFWMVALGAIRRTKRTA